MSYNNNQQEVPGRHPNLARQELPTKRHLPSILPNLYLTLLQLSIWQTDVFELTLKYEMNKMFSR